jgi:hypothetical protein
MISSVSLHRNGFKDVTDTETARISLHRIGKNIIDLDVDSVLKEKKVGKDVCLSSSGFFLFKKKQRHENNKVRCDVEKDLLQTWFEGTLSGASAASGARASRRRGSID